MSSDISHPISRSYSLTIEGYGIEVELSDGLKQREQKGRALRDFSKSLQSSKVNLR